MLFQAANSVIDQEDRLFELVDELSMGGQGAVYRTNSDTDLVKLFFSGTDALDEIARVRRMPLTDLPVSRPMSLISDPSGYTLQFQRDMDVVRSLKYNHTSSVRDWWLDTGGLSRRLWLGSRIASVFERLHMRGLVYGDLNSNNIMVSKSKSYNEVSLIDLDNLFYFGERESADVWTPTYSAPEIAQGFSPPTFSSDDFSLAVILFELLTMVHPFMDGDAVKREPTTSQYFELAQRCLVPSVIDSDSSNRCSVYPVQNESDLLGDELLDLFQKSLQVSSLDTGVRASSGDLRLAMVRAVLGVIDCQKCAWSYSAVNLIPCPDCGAKESTCRLRILSGDGTTAAFEIILGGTPRTIDFGLLFPVIQEREQLRNSYVVDFFLLNRQVRIMPRNHDLIDTPRYVEDSVTMHVKKFGELKIEVEYR